MGLVSEQSLYNLTARTIELEVIPALRHYGLSLIPWSPLAWGALVLNHTSEGRRGLGWNQAFVDEHEAQFAEYEAFCNELGEQPADVALAWLLHQPAVTATLIGARTPEQLTASQRALQVQLSEDALARFDKIWPGPGGEAPQAYAW
jgi:aryl-alcohol dehydrogenase-like predicted oxidoreductase